MTEPVTPLNDAMPPRELVARWVICGTIVLESALHLGGEGSALVDMPILRDARDGVPLLPGTTFTGALRNALTNRLAGYSEAEPAAVAVLFGGSRGDESGSQSPLIVFDALGKLPPEFGVEIRDGVSISPATGTAEGHKKYDFEVLPAGTRFRVRLDLLLPAPLAEKSGPSADAIHSAGSVRRAPADDAGIGGQPIDEGTLLGELAAALDAFSPGEGSLGARRSRGLGRVSATWHAKRFDLTTEAGWLEWLTSDHLDPIPAGQASILDALNLARPAAFQLIALPADRRKRIVITATLNPHHDLLIRSPGTEADDPDVVHLRSGGKQSLPGTSVAGAARAQALRIARLVRDGKGDAERWVNRLIGARFEGQRPPPGTSPVASRLLISETGLDGSTSARQVRIAIDRFTQGVVDGALFDEGTSVGGTAEVTFELRNPEDGELGLVLLVLKDLLEGWLPVGGTSSVGRGMFRGSARVDVFAGDGSGPRVAMLIPGQYPTGAAAESIAAAIQAFHDIDPLSPGTGDAPAKAKV